jgi:tungstate transport system ATP-binding protein
MKRDDLAFNPHARRDTGELLTTLSDVSLRFGAVQALTGINLQLRRGDRLALVGANGSGKTSLLRLLHGLVAPSNGERLTHTLAAEQRDAVGAMLFQHPFLLSLSVRRNVLLALWLRGVARADRAARCDEALAKVGLLALAQRPARALSGGQQQRLALARAWALLPDILFLDEPTASLDPSAKREVETLIEQIADHGVTVVMSTHNLGQVKRLASRVVYLEAGRLVVDLPIDAFFHLELPHAAAAFLKGELPWN